MWMGGQPSLGYDVKERKLVVNEAEAATVRYIFRRYLELKTVRALRDDLAAAGVVSKRRTAADGSPYGGQRFSRGALYLMLKNRDLPRRDRPQGQSIAPENTQRSSMKICGDACKAISKRTGWSGGKATKPSNQACWSASSSTPVPNP